MERMNAIVTIGRRSCRIVFANVVPSALAGTPRTIIGTNAMSAATKTSVPAAARKSRR